MSYIDYFGSIHVKGSVFTGMLGKTPWSRALLDGSYIAVIVPIPSVLNVF